MRLVSDSIRRAFRTELQSNLLVILKQKAFLLPVTCAFVTRNGKHIAIDSEDSNV
jgi:hypothetical protein